MKTIFNSVGFQDESGNLLVNGSLIFSLPPGIYLILSGGGQVVGRSVIVNLDANAKVPSGIQVFASDELNGSPLYRATLCRNANGFGPVASVNWLISGTSPIDLSLLTQH
jgi:hypothetical protein